MCAIDDIWTVMFAMAFGACGALVAVALIHFDKEDDPNGNDR